MFSFLVQTLIFFSHFIISHIQIFITTPVLIDRILRWIMMIAQLVFVNSMRVTMTRFFLKQKRHTMNNK